MVVEVPFKVSPTIYWVHSVQIFSGWLRGSELEAEVYISRAIVIVHGKCVTM